MRRCWINFQCQGVLLIWIIVGQGPIVLAVGADGGCLDIFSLIYHFCFLSPSLWEMARYRLKYCLKGLLSPKQPTNQPINMKMCVLIILNYPKSAAMEFFFQGTIERVRNSRGKQAISVRATEVLLYFCSCYSLSSRCNRRPELVRS